MNHSLLKKWKNLNKKQDFNSSCDLIANIKNTWNNTWSWACKTFSTSSQQVLQIGKVTHKWDNISTFFLNCHQTKNNYQFFFVFTPLHPSKILPDILSIEWSDQSYLVVKMLLPWRDVPTVERFSSSKCKISCCERRRTSKRKII